MKKNSTPRVTTDAKLNGHLMLILDGSGTGRETKAGRRSQPEGVRLQLLVLIHNGDPSLHSAQRWEGAWKCLQITVPIENFHEKRQPSLPPVGTKSGPAVEGGAKSQVKNLPLLASDLDSTDPILACTMGEATSSPAQVIHLGRSRGL